MTRLTSCPSRVEQLVEIEDRRQLAADLGQRLEGVARAALVLEQARVLERDADVGRELAEQRHVRLVEGVAWRLRMLSAPMTRVL